MHSARIALALVLPLAAAGCSGDGDEDQVLTVLAAASLTDVFEELAVGFEDEHGAEVRFSFGSSTTLAEQAVQNAPGDVLATADEVSMEVARDGDALADDPVAFATNRMVLVVPSGNPGGIDGFADLAGADWVRCADDVPCGRVALTLLGANPVIGEPVSLEVDVRSVLAKVTSGEADAGFVYATDAAAAEGDVDVLDIPGAERALTAYFVAPLGDAETDELAAAWVELVTSTAGEEALTDAEFTVP